MTRQALALSLLEEAGSRGVTTAEFMDAGVGSRYSARLLELRKAGHRITSERVREGSWKYVLLTDEMIEANRRALANRQEGHQVLDAEVGGGSTVSNPAPPATAADLSAAGIPVLKAAEWLKLFESAA